MIHFSMKTKIDVVSQTRKFYLPANLLLLKLRHCSDQVRCTLFQTYCTNMYCCQMWFKSTISSLKKLSTSYNSVLRQGSLYLTGNESDYVIRHTHERDRPTLGSVKIDKAKYTSYTLT